MASPSSRTINLTLWAAVAFLGLVGAAALWSIDSLRGLTRDSAQTEKILQAASVLRNRMSDAQAALMVFVATGDAKEIPRFEEEIGTARRDLAAFETTLDEDQRARHGRDLRSLFDAQFRVMEGVMRLRAQQGFGAALEVVRSQTYQSQVRLGENLVGDIAQTRDRK